MNIHLFSFFFTPIRTFDQRENRHNQKNQTRLMCVFTVRFRTVVERIEYESMCVCMCVCTFSIFFPLSLSLSLSCEHAQNLLSCHWLFAPFFTTSLVVVLLLLPGSSLSLTLILAYLSLSSLFVGCNAA